MVRLISLLDLPGGNTLLVQDDGHENVFSQNCSVEWRCVGLRQKAAESNGPNTLEQDGGSLNLAPEVCPRSWVRLVSMVPALPTQFDCMVALPLEANGVCDAPSSYGGPCAHRMHFAGMSDEQVDFDFGLSGALCP